jgi:hypothetical protein
MFDIFKSLAETCTIYEFIDFSAQSHAKGELKEKSLIALFGHSSLLNKQLGGFTMTMPPQDTRNHCFSRWTPMHLSD